MAVIRRELKLWDNNTGQSDHYGLEIDIEKDLGLLPAPGNEIEGLQQAIILTDVILREAVRRARDNEEPLNLTTALRKAPNIYTPEDARIEHAIENRTTFDDPNPDRRTHSDAEVTAPQWTTDMDARR